MDDQAKKRLQEKLNNYKRSLDLITPTSEMAGKINRMKKEVDFVFGVIENWVKGEGHTRDQLDHAAGMIGEHFSDLNDVLMGEGLSSDKVFNIAKASNQAKEFYETFQLEFPRQASISIEVRMNEPSWEKLTKNVKKYQKDLEGFSYSRFYEKEVDANFEALLDFYIEKTNQEIQSKIEVIQKEAKAMLDQLAKSPSESVAQELRDTMGRHIIVIDKILTGEKFPVGARDYLETVKRGLIDNVAIIDHGFTTIPPVVSNKEPIHETNPFEPIPLPENSPSAFLEDFKAFEERLNSYKKTEDQNEKPARKAVEAFKSSAQKLKAFLESGEGKVLQEQVLSDGLYKKLVIFLEEVNREGYADTKNEQEFLSEARAILEETMNKAGDHFGIGEGIIGSLRIRDKLQAGEILECIPSIQSFLEELSRDPEAVKGQHYARRHLITTPSIDQREKIMEEILETEKEFRRNIGVLLKESLGLRIDGVQGSDEKSLKEALKGFEVRSKKNKRVVVDSQGQALFQIKFEKDAVFLKSLVSPKRYSDLVPLDESLELMKKVALHLGGGPRKVQPVFVDNKTGRQESLTPSEKVLWEVDTLNIQATDTRFFS